MSARLQGVKSQQIARPGLRPIRAAPKDNAPHPHTIRPPLTQTPTNATSAPFIVLVDDEAVFADLMGTLLEHALGVPTRIFHDPRQALEAISGTTPALVIADYRMPGLDGFDFIREVGTRCPGVPAILVTGNLLENETIARRKPPSLLNVLFKPLSWRDIAAVIREHDLLPSAA